MGGGRPRSRRRRRCRVNRSANWRPAGEVFPQLRRSGPLQAATNPFAEQPLESPFAAPARHDTADRTAAC